MNGISSIRTEVIVRDIEYQWFSVKKEVLKKYKLLRTSSLNKLFR